MNVIPLRLRCPDVGRYRPWRELRERGDVEFYLTDLPDQLKGLLAQGEGWTAILIDRSLDPVERLCVLTHELAHLERDGSGHVAGLPSSMHPLVQREEERVDRIVADRLLPNEDLRPWVEAMLDMGEPVMAAGAAAEFDVTVPVAMRALRRLGGRAA